jgi:hypothetical protein
MTIVWTVAALLCTTAVDGQALGKPIPVHAHAETATLERYVDEIATVEGISQASARTAVHRRRHLTR